MASSWQKVMFFLGLVDEEESQRAEAPPAPGLEFTDPGLEKSAPPVQSMNPEPPPAVPHSNEPAAVAGRVAGRRVEPTNRRRRPILGGVSEPTEPGGSVVPISAGSTEVIVAKVFADAQRIADLIRERRAVVLDLRSTEPEMVRRLVDFSSGLTYALDGTMRKIAQGVILVAPSSFLMPDHERDRLVGLGLYAAPDAE